MPSHSCKPMKMAKERAVKKAMKNSAKLTDPIVYLGSRPEPTNVVVTTGPQPPPPIASTKPPNNAKGIIPFVFFFLSTFLNAFLRITIPIINK